MFGRFFKQIAYIDTYNRHRSNTNMLSSVTITLTGMDVKKLKKIFSLYIAVKIGSFLLYMGAYVLGM